MIGSAGETVPRRTRSDCSFLIRTDWASIPSIRHICIGDVGGKKRLLPDYTDRPGGYRKPLYMCKGPNHERGAIDVRQPEKADRDTLR